MKNSTNICHDIHVKKSLKIPKGGNQNPYIEEQTTQEKGQKKKQRSTKHTYKTKDKVTRTSQKPEVISGAPEG